MKKYKEQELKLNNYPDPTSFHDMSVVNMQFLNDSINIRFVLAKYMDDFEILEDDEHFAILEVVYSGVNITNMNLSGVINFRFLDVLGLHEKDGVITLDLYSDEYDCYFHLVFTYKLYCWKVIDVIAEDEYDDYYCEMLQSTNKLNEINTYKGPKWSNFED